MNNSNIIEVIVTAIAALMVIFNWVIKLVAGDEVVKPLTHFGPSEKYEQLFAVLEIGFTLLIVYPRRGEMDSSRSPASFLFSGNRFCHSSPFKT